MKKQFKFTSNAWEHNNTRLTNQIYKLLPMYEDGEDWKKQQATVIFELHGYNEMFQDNPQFMLTVDKLFALNKVSTLAPEFEMTEHEAFRKLIFEAITALKEIII